MPGFSARGSTGGYFAEGLYIWGDFCLDFVLLRGMVACYPGLLGLVACSES